MENEDRFIISHVRRPGQFSMDLRHSHDRHEIYWLMSGERNYFIRDQVHHVGKGDFVVIPAGEFHKTTTSGSQGHERMLVEFSDSFLTGYLPGGEFLSGSCPAGNAGARDLKRLMAFFAGVPPVIKPSGELRLRMESLFARLLEEGTANRPEREMILSAMLVELLVLLSRACAAGTEGPREHPDPVHRGISEISQFISAQYAGEISLGSVSRRFGLSESHLSRTFLRVTGVHFVTFLVSVRVREASRLLCATDMQVGDIAEKTGFASSTSFGRVFRQQIGLSPREYRNLHRDRA